MNGKDIILCETCPLFYNLLKKAYQVEHNIPAYLKDPIGQQFTVFATSKVPGRESSTRRPLGEKGLGWLQEKKGRVMTDG